MQELPAKPTELAAMLSISVAYASHILKGERPWTKALAISVFRQTGARVGPLVGASDEEIDVLERFETPREGAAA